MKSLPAYASGMAALVFLAAVVAILFIAPYIGPTRSGKNFHALARCGLTFGLSLSLVGVEQIETRCAARALTCA